MSNRVKTINLTGEERTALESILHQGTVFYPRQNSPFEE